MSEHTGNSPKKFPYLVLSNASTPFENIDGVNSSRGQVPREKSQRGYPQAEPQTMSYSGTAYLSYIKDRYQPEANFITHATTPVVLNEFTPPMVPLNNVSMAQMKAILTAQKELRKPAGSLYPSASQTSLIPETEMIYKKYFPLEGNESPAEKISNKKFSIGKSGQMSSTATVSVSESNITAGGHSKIAEIHVPKLDGGYVQSTRAPETPKVVSNDKHVAIKQRDAELRFKKRVQAQLVSLCSEVERQSSELLDIKKEIKDLLNMSRKNTADSDSSKSRLDTLSKHIQEIDSKMETMSGQEKSLLSKLMLFGEISDSDSDLDEPAIKGEDIMGSSSATKLTMLTSAKRPLSPGSSSDCLSKSCCNWVPIAPDFDKLIQAVALINYRMDRNQSMKLCTTSKGATFKHSDVIEMTIFKNGISLGSSGFRSYSTMSVIRFVNELFNGYLPTELSTQYPDGVVIVLTDKRSVIRSSDESFNGSGSKLSAKDPPDLLPGACINSLKKKESMESLKASTTTSLLSLPTSTCAGVSSYEILPDLKTVGQGESDNKGIKEKMITLKMKDRKNGYRYKLTVPVNATIKAVTDHVGIVLKEKDGISENVSSDSTYKSFDIILPVPYGKLSCTSSTLEEYGLTQNTLVYIEEQKTSMNTVF